MTSVIILYPFSIILNASENMTAFFDIRIMFSLFVPYETAGLTIWKVQIHFVLYSVFSSCTKLNFQNIS